MKKIKIISCLTTLGIMILIFSFSAQNAETSSEVSRGFADKIVDIITVMTGASAEEKVNIGNMIHGFIRKAAHFTIYASLGISSFIMFKSWLGKGKKTTIVIATGFCMLYAISDELHQLASSGRSAELRDVLIDTAGAVTGIMLLIAAAVLIRLKKRVKKEV